MTTSNFCAKQMHQTNSNTYIARLQFRMLVLVILLHLPLGPKHQHLQGFSCYNAREVTGTGHAAVGQNCPQEPCKTEQEQLLKYYISVNKISNEIMFLIKIYLS